MSEPWPYLNKFEDHEALNRIEMSGWLSEPRVIPGTFEEAQEIRDRLTVAMVMLEVYAGHRVAQRHGVTARAADRMLREAP